MPSIWRSLIRITRVSKDKAYCISSSWNHLCVFPLQIDSIENPYIKNYLRSNPKLPFRVIAYMDLSAEHPKDLKPHRFEVAPEPRIEDLLD